MLIYPKTKKDVQKDSPVWKEDNFLRLRGLADALVHKTDFKTEDGKNVLAGAYYERVRRELETLEAAKLAQLSKSLGPKAAALKAMPEPTGAAAATAAAPAPPEHGVLHAKPVSAVPVPPVNARSWPRPSGQSCWMPRHRSMRFTAVRTQAL